MIHPFRQRRIYVASSWRCVLQQGVVHTLRAAGHLVYDFRNPTDGPARAGARGIGTGFQWSEVDPDWQCWTPEAYRRALEHPRSIRGFDADFNAMVASDTCVLVLPCGRSAHLEAGYFCGSGKALYVLMLEPQEPELMYRMATGICLTLAELLDAVGVQTHPQHRDEVLAAEAGRAFAGDVSPIMVPVSDTETAG